MHYLSGEAGAKENEYPTNTASPPSVFENHEELPTHAVEEQCHEQDLELPIPYIGQSGHVEYYQENGQRVIANDVHEHQKPVVDETSTAAVQRDAKEPEQEQLLTTEENQHAFATDGIEPEISQEEQHDDENEELQENSSDGHDYSDGYDSHELEKQNSSWDVTAKRSSFSSSSHNDERDMDDHEEESFRSQLSEDSGGAAEAEETPTYDSGSAFLDQTPGHANSESEDTGRFIRVADKHLRIRPDVSLPAHRDGVSVAARCPVKLSLKQLGTEPVLCHVKLRPLTDIDILEGHIPVWARLAEQAKEVLPENSETAVALDTNIDIPSLPLPIGNTYRRLQNEIGRKTFRLSGIYFNETVAQSTVYERTVQSAVFQTTEGVHTAIVAYGLKDSGRSHTLLGTSECPGLIPQAFSDLFAHLESYANLHDNAFLGELHQPHSAFSRPLVWRALEPKLFKHRSGTIPKAHFVVRVAMVNIYGSDVTDLLVSAGKMSQEMHHQPRLAKDSAVTVDTVFSAHGDSYELKNACWAPVTSLPALLELLTRVLAFRQKSAKPDHHLVIALKVERAVVDIQKHSRRRAVTTGKLYNILGKIKLLERTEGSLMFVLPAGVDALHLQSGEGGGIEENLYWLHRTLEELAHSKGQSDRLVSALKAAKNSPLTKILYSYLFHHARLVMIFPLNPSLRLAKQTREVLAFAAELSRVKCKLEVCHTGWSSGSYYCQSVSNALTHLQLDIQDMLDTLSPDHQRLQRLELQVAMVCIPGKGSWSSLRDRRLIPIRAAYVAKGLKDTVKQKVVYYKTSRQAEPPGNTSSQPPSRAAMANKTILKELRQLRQRQTELSTQLERMQEFREVDERHEQQRRLQERRNALERGLSVPQRPPGFPIDASPQFPAFEKAPLGQLSLPEHTPFIDADDHQPETSQFSTRAVPYKSTTPKPEWSPSAGKTAKKDLGVLGPSLKWGYEAALPLHEKRKRRAQRRPSVIRRPVDPISRFLIGLLKGQHHFQSSSTSCTSTSPSLLSTPSSSSSPRSSCTGRSSGLSTDRERSRTRHKSSERSVSPKTRRPKATTDAKRAEPQQQQGDTPTQDQQSRDSQLPIPKKPTIHASGGLRIDRNGSGAPFYGGGHQAPGYPNMGAAYPSPWMTGRGPYGEMGLPIPPTGYGPGTYPPGSMVPPGMVPVKPTIEGHLAPAGFTPYATFRYPSPRKEPKPIVVHLHQHRNGSSSTTTKDKQLVVETPRTAEGCHAAIATATAVKADAEKRENTVNDQERGTAYIPKQPPAQPYGYPPWYMQPSPLMSFQHPSLVTVPPSSPSHLQVGFEGAVDLDPALLKGRKRTSRHSTRSRSSTASRKSGSRSKRAQKRRARRRDDDGSRHDRSRGHRHSSTSTTEKQQKAKHLKEAGFTKRDRVRRSSHKRSLLIPKLLQQLYYFPETVDHVVEKDLQELLPLLQPFEASKLKKALEAYRAAKEGDPSSYERERHSESPYEATAAARRGSRHGERAGFNRALAVNYVASSSSTPSLSDLESGSLVHRINDTERVTRKHYRAVLRGEAKGAQDRETALCRKELLSQMRHMETSELLDQLRKDPTVRTQRRELMGLNETKIRTPQEQDVVEGTQFRYPSAGPYGGSGHIGDSTTLTVGRGTAGSLRPEKLARLSDIAMRLLGTPAESGGEQGGSLPQEGTSPRRRTSVQRRLYSDVTDAPRRDLDSQDIATGRPSRDDTLTSEETSGPEQLHKQAEDVQVAMRSLVESLQTESQQSPESEQPHLTPSQGASEVRNLPLISVSLAVPTEVDPPTPEVPLELSAPPKSTPPARQQKFLQIPGFNGSATSPPEHIKHAAAQPEEKRVRADIRGAATVEGDLRLLTDMARVMTPSRPDMVQPHATAFPPAPVAVLPPVTGTPVVPGGDINSIARHEYDPTVWESATHVAEEESSSPTYVAHFKVPEDDQEPASAYIAQQHFPPPLRQKILPDAGSPVPLSSLLWGGAEGSANNVGRFQFPSSQAHFQEIRTADRSADGATCNRFERPVRDWETLGLTAGMEDLPHDQVVWRERLRPFLARPWRERVMKTFSDMREHSGTEGSQDTTHSRRRESFAPATSQIRAALGEQRRLRDAEVTARYVKLAAVAPETVISDTAGRQNSDQHLQMTGTLRASGRLSRELLTHPTSREQPRSQTPSSVGDSPPLVHNGAQDGNGASSQEACETRKAGLPKRQTEPPSPSKAVDTLRRTNTAPPSLERAREHVHPPLDHRACSLSASETTPSKRHAFPTSQQQQTEKLRNEWCSRSVQTTTEPAPCPMEVTQTHPLAVSNKKSAEGNRSIEQLRAESCQLQTPLYQHSIGKQPDAQTRPSSFTATPKEEPKQHGAPASLYRTAPFLHRDLPCQPQLIVPVGATQHCPYVVTRLPSRLVYAAGDTITEPFMRRLEPYVAMHKRAVRSTLAQHEHHSHHKTQQCRIDSADDWKTARSASCPVQRVTAVRPLVNPSMCAVSAHNLPEMPLWRRRTHARRDARRSKQTAQHRARDSSSSARRAQPCSVSPVALFRRRCCHRSAARESSPYRFA